MKWMMIVFSALMLSATASFANEHGGGHAEPAKPAKIECPSQKFKEFLSDFTEDTELQVAFTAIPGVNNDETTFPMIPALAGRTKRHLNISTVEEKEKTAKVMLFRDDIQYKVAFSFEKKACWMLVAVEDLSTGNQSSQ